MKKVSAFSASLRNARSREGAKVLAQEIAACESYEALSEYLVRQGNLHLEKFYTAGRKDGLSYDLLHEQLANSKGLNGLSNSEVCAAAALWGAKEAGAEIQLVPLAHYFKADGTVQDIHELERHIIDSDGLIISSPVYFGDRSSLSQRFIEFIRNNPELRSVISDKVYGGTTVGAKRNGGQETSLIYQMCDLIEIGALGVGNDYITTSQYGGTGWAGDVATMPQDEYGLGTCVGTGRRVANISNLLEFSQRYVHKTPIKASVWVLQDKEEKIDELLAPYIEQLSGAVEFTITHLEKEVLLPCMGCDICPNRVGLDSEYRCVRGKSDTLYSFHEQLLDSDIIIPAVLSLSDRTGLMSTYQQFLERTRYIRRGDYALANRLLLPLVFSELGCNEHMDIRMITSLIRHQTVVHKPVLGYLLDGKLINPHDVELVLQSAINKGLQLTIGRKADAAVGAGLIKYKPTGYVLPACKANTSKDMKKREEAMQERQRKAQDVFSIELIERAS